jgi:hypothetical protein
MKNIIFIAVVTALVFATAGCDKGKEVVDNKITEDYPKDYSIVSIEKTVTEKDVSKYLRKILNLTDIKKIKFVNKASCEIIFRDGKTGRFKISDKLVSLKLEKNNYQLSFYEDRFVVNNLTTQIKVEYFEIGNLTQNIDKAITTSVAIIFYLEEIGNLDYNENQQPLYASETYWCIHPRKSWCSKERMDKFLKKYCGGAPSIVGGTDCGCAWGDFLCVCMTDFEC